MPYFLAIEYKLSPDFTVYVFSLLSLVGISNCSPTFRFVELKLLYFTRVSTVVLYFWAIEYKLSPFDIVYTV